MGEEADEEADTLFLDNASAATVQSALEALSTIGTGNVAVVKTVDASNDQKWQLTFVGTLADRLQLGGFGHEMGRQG